MKRIGITAILLSLFAAGAIIWRLRPNRLDWVTDAAAIREPLASARIREVLWKPPTSMPTMPDAAEDLYEPRITADGLRLYFVRGRPGSNADIFDCRKTRAGWSPPEALAAINSESDDLGPEPSPDGQSIYFYSDRPGGIGGYDLWVSRLGEDGWQPPTNLGAFINSPYNDYGPAISPDGRTLCFATNRPMTPAQAPKEGAWQATIREDLYQHDYDLYSVGLDEDAAPRIDPLASLNSTANEGAPAFSPVGDFLYFSSDRSGGFGAFDLYRARRVAPGFQSPENLGGTVNTPANDLDPALSMGGYHLLFSSDRPTAVAATPNSAAPPQRRYALYETQSREVFRDIEFRPVTIDWPGLWRQIGPNLLWAILALIVSLLLITLLRDLRGGKLSLLARCLLASLLIHALLMLLFNVVEVTTAVASALRRSDHVRVTLASVVHGDSLARQIRGNLSEALALEPVALESPDRADPPIAVPEPAIARLPTESSISRPPDRPLVESTPEESPDRPAQLPVPTVDAPELSSPSGHLDTPGEMPKARSTETTPAPFVSNALTPTSRPDLLIAATQPATDLVRVALNPAALAHTPSVADSSLAAASMPDATPAPPPQLTTLLARQSAPSSTAAAVNLTLPNSPPPIAQAALEPQSLAERGLNEAGRAVGAIPIERSVLATPAADSATHASFSPTPVLPPSSAMREASLETIDAAPSDAAARPMAAAATSTSDLAPRLRMLPIALATPADHTPLPARTSEAPNHPLAMPARPERAEIPDSSPIATAAPVVRMAPAAASTTYQEKSLLPPNVVTPMDLVEAGGAPTLPVALMSDAPPTAPSVALDLALPSEVEPPPALDAVSKSASTPEEGVVGRPVAGTPEGPMPRTIGAIVGRVTNAETGEPLFGAEVRLDLPDSPNVVAATSRAGRYELLAPQMPDYFAVSATAESFTPESSNVAASSMTGTTMTLDFALRPISEYVVALEDDPPVHHLGNDLFEGRINSQFQRDSEGKFFAARFKLAAQQLAPRVRRGEVTLLAKGVQCPHKVRLNGQTLAQRLDASPSDGSFGEMTVEFDPALLHEGENAFILRAVSCRGDLDDFEFVNVRIRLYP